MHTGLDVGVKVDAGTFAHVAPPKLETLDEGVACELGLGADEEQEFAHLGLEYDDQSDDTNINDAAKYLGAETHIEEVGNSPTDDDTYYCPKDADDVGTFYQSV